MLLSDCKKEAKQRLKTRKLRAFRITFSIGAIGILSAVAAFFLPELFDANARDDSLLFVSQTALGLISFGISGTLRQGRAAWLYCSACGREPSFVQFLFWLRKGRGFRAAFLHTLIRIRKAVWIILLSAPGAAVLTGAALWSTQQNDLSRIVTWTGGCVCLVIGLVFAALINQKYALAPILYAKSPEKGVRSAIRGSCFLMDDSCVRLFLLKLSFLPWAIPGIAILPLMYIVPYYQQSTTCMLCAILHKHTI